jgi:thiol-disulfide isomerase/thioredoxin
MKLKSVFTLFVVLASIAKSFAQQVTIYKTTDGRMFSKEQKDSIANLGFPIGIKERINKADTIILMMEIYSKGSLKTPFQETFEGKQVPRMVLTEFDGKRIELPVKGRITFVNFWSVTCGPCVAEIPQLNELFIKYNSQVLFLAVSPDSKERIDSFLKKVKFNFHMISAPEIFKKYNIDGYPKNLFIDKRGNVVLTKEGTPSSRKSETDEWIISVFEDYSKIIERLVADE